MKALGGLHGVKALGSWWNPATWFADEAVAYTPTSTAPTVDAALVAQNAQIVAMMEQYRNDPEAAPVSWGTYAAIGATVLIGGVILVGVARRYA